MDLAHLVLIGLTLAAMALAALAVLAACVVGLIMAGVGAVSVSVVIGCWRRSVLAGVQAFFIQAGIFTGAASGAVLAWLLVRVWPEVSQEIVVLALGGAGGAVAGLIVALLAHAMVEKISHQLPRLAGRLLRTSTGATSPGPALPSAAPAESSHGTLA